MCSSIFVAYATRHANRTLDLDARHSGCTRRDAGQLSDGLSALPKVPPTRTLEARPLTVYPVGGRASWLAGCEFGFEVVEDAAEESADLHLGDAEVGGDLGLGPAAEEAEGEDLAVPVGEVFDQWGERDPDRGAVEVAVVGAQPVGQGVAVAGGAAAVDRGGGEAAVGGEGFVDLGLGDAEPVGQLGRPGRPFEFLGEWFGDGGDVGLQFLDPPGCLDRPALVPEVSLDLTGDGGHGVGAEVVATVRVVAVDRLHQPHIRDLRQILRRLPTTPIPRRHRPRHIHIQQRRLLFETTLALTLAPACFGEQSLSLIGLLTALIAAAGLSVLAGFL